MERLTGSEATSSEAPNTQVGEEVQECTNEGKYIRCASPADSRCLSGRLNGCCDHLIEPNSKEWESLSASRTSGRKSRKESSQTGVRKAGTCERDRRPVSAAADLACVLLFGHMMNELLDSDPSHRSR